MKDCDQTLEELQMFLDGELPEEQQQRVLLHLSECMECYHAYDLQAELKQIIAAKCANEPLPAGAARPHQAEPGQRVRLASFAGTVLGKNRATTLLGKIRVGV